MLRQIVAEELDYPFEKINWIQVIVHWLNSSPIRASALRGLGSPQNTFANESFMDELAAGVGLDPMEFRLQHFKRSAR